MFQLCCLTQNELEVQNGKMEAKNTIRIQISVAIITYCLVTIVHHDMQLKRPTYEVLQILNISSTDKPHPRDLFDKTIFNYSKNSTIPSLREYLINELTCHFLLDTNEEAYFKEDQVIYKHAYTFGSKYLTT